MIMMATTVGVSFLISGAAAPVAVVVVVAVAARSKQA